MSTKELARKAIAAAARIRQQGGHDAFTAICPIDLAERLGIDVRFEAISSLEGMYSPGSPPIIVLSSLRPSGRQRLNCGHEIGHHAFGHGTRVDELIDAPIKKRFEPAEFLATCFAEYLLAPKLAVVNAFRVRGLSMAAPSPLDVYRVAVYFGIGFRTMLNHLEHNLLELDPMLAVKLRRTTPTDIRTSILGFQHKGELVIADEHWSGRAIDLQVGDLLLMPEGTVCEGASLRADAFHSSSLATAIRPGLARAEHLSLKWSSFVRVSRRAAVGGFTGRSIYRHLEDPDE